MFDLLSRSHFIWRIKQIHKIIHEIKLQSSLEKGIQRQKQYFNRTKTEQKMEEHEQKMSECKKTYFLHIYTIYNTFVFGKFQFFGFTKKKDDHIVYKYMRLLMWWFWMIHFKKINTRPKNLPIYWEDGKNLILNTKFYVFLIDLWRIFICRANKYKIKFWIII